MVKASRAGWRRLPSRALPCVQADVMMITTGRHKRRLLAEALSDFKAEHVAVKGQRAFQIGHLQMNVANPDAGIHGLRAGVWFHACLRVQQSASTAQLRGSCYLVKHKTKDGNLHVQGRVEIIPVAAPRSNFSERELAALIEFAEKGAPRSLIIKKESIKC